MLKHWLKNTFLLVLLISTLNSLGQHNLYDDTSTINSLLERAKFVRVKNVDSAKVLLLSLKKQCSFALLNSKTVKKNTQIETVYLKKLAKIVYLLAETNNIGNNKKSALGYFKEAENTFLLLNDSLNIAHCLYEKAAINSELGNIPEALNDYTVGLKIFEKFNDKKLIAKSLNGMAVIFKNKSQIKEALSYYERSLKIFEQINDKNGMAGTLCNMGVICKGQDQLKEALDYYARSLSTYKAINNKKGQGKVLSNIGSIYFLQKKMDTALVYFDLSLKINEEIDDRISTASSLNNIGAVFFEKGQFDKALEHFKKSLTISQSINNKSGVAKSCTSISDIYLRKNNLNEALKYSLTSLKLSQELGYPFIIKASALNLKKIYQAQNNSKKALEMFEIYVSMSDSLNSQEAKELSYKSKLNYDYSRKILTDSLNLASKINLQKTQLLLELKEQKQLQQLYMFGIILIVVFFLILFIYKNYVYTKKSLVTEKKFSTQLLDEMEKERNRIARELHDGINQNLIVAKRFSINNENKAAANIIDTCIEEIRQISREMLPVYIKEESLKFSLIMLINKVEVNTNMLVSYYIEDINFSDEVKLQLYRITQECISNSLKHSKANAINIQLKKDKFVTLQIEDDGEGFNIDETNTNHFGLITIRQRAKAIGAKMEIKSKIKEGVQITITL